MTSVRFDKSLPKFVLALTKRLGPEKVNDGLFLRDGAGLLTFVLPDEHLSAAERRKLSHDLEEELSPYVATDGYAVATRQELLDDGLGLGAIDVPINDVDRVHRVRLVDRRIIGADWLLKPAPLLDTPTLVFASLKGGVGRSTALCVCASALASQGRRVLAVDMDVEAPGLGTMLLSPETIPVYGLLDYLVESSLGSPADELLVDMIAPSWLGAGKGVVDILPAIGSATLAHPSNVMSKFARAYLNPSGESGVSHRLKDLFELVVRRRGYDVILVDARAGLHETSAAAFLGLGGHILLFGANQPQTFAAYDLLFATLSQSHSDEWSERLTVVQAKTRGQESADRFKQGMQEVLEKWTTSKAELSSFVPPETWKGIFEVDWSDEDGARQLADEVIRAVQERDEHQIVEVLDSDLFRDFDPILNPDRLNDDVYAAIFGSLVEHVFEVVG